MINVFQPTLGEEELAALRDVFAGNWLGHGPRTKAFEEAFAGHLGVRPEQLLFINSATAGLFLSTQLAGLGPGDDVVLPSASFVSAANAIASTGARPVFCDVDPRTLNPSVDDIRQAWTPRTRAVVILHYGGYPGQAREIADLCRERGALLIEDAACAVASRADGQACGTFGDLAVWSFDSMKVLVTGDGGMLYVRDPELAAQARRLAYHGLERPSSFGAAKVSHRWWEMQVREHGQRVLGNDMTAALGLVQLGRLPEFVATRRRHAEQYDRLLADVRGLRLPPKLPEGHETSYYFYWVQVDPALRDRLAAELLELGIYTTFRYPPLHRVPVYRSDHLRLPATDEASEATLLLPLHHGLTSQDVESVATAVRKVLQQLTDSADGAGADGGQPAATA
ncbi:DegT/DnrJ/EryC1/StrS family aminotransferase [Streptomyces sp. NPDC014870]|uniref:DegT/DnrJ/EryC1/StrS family aminotransferase n=1 Tax=Streptomyces sp. NPDC014870 TaxID=3364925 RepID=UPI0037016BDC